MKVVCSVDHASCRKYYTNQGGSGIDIYRSYPVQGGSGLGAVLGGLFRTALPAIRTALPLIRRMVKTVVPQLFKTGLRVVGDVASGQSFGKSLKDRTLETVSDSLLRAADEKALKGTKRQRGRAGNGVRQPRRKRQRYRTEAY